MANWLIWTALGLLLLVLLTSVASFSLRIPSRARLAEKMELQGRRDELQRLLEHRVELLLSTSSLRACTVLGFTLLVVELVGRRAGGFGFETYLWSFIVIIVAVLSFGVAIPYAWARYAGESLLIALLPALHGLRYLFYPVVAPLLGLDWLVRRLAGVHADHAALESNGMEQEILTVVSEGEARGAVDEEEKEMIESVIELRDTQVDQIMTPRTEISAVSKDITFAQLREHIRASGHSRVPVYDQTIDDIIGIIYAKDLLHVSDIEAFEAARIMRAPIYVPESKQTRELLHEFQEGKGHMAIVLDEYGGTAGLVTIEDILEELVGEIVDEYEEQEAVALRHIDECTVDVDARMRIDELNDELNLQLPESEDYETIGGFVFSLLGKIPQAGAECAHDNVKIRVTDAGPRRIKRLCLQIARPGAPSNGAA